MKTLDSSKYFNLVSAKYGEFAQALNAGFNKLNNLEAVADPGQKVAELHALIINNREFDKSLFTEEEYKAEENIRTEELRRLQAILSGDMKVYSPTEKELEMLVVSPSEILDCLISEDEYKEELSEYVNG